MLPIAMLTGASAYLIYHNIPCLQPAGPILAKIVGFVQPMLIFLMLFLSFCRIRPQDLKLHRWHLWLLGIQGGLFVLFGLLLLVLIPDKGAAASAAASSAGMSGGELRLHILLESAMICLICPTATASAVVTGKLHGDIAGITTYIILVNILTSLLVPLMVPLIHPVAGFTFGVAFSMIVAKIFPLLIFPCLAAWLVRYLTPRLHRFILKYPDLPFQMWAIALSLAIAVTTKALVHTNVPFSDIVIMALVSLLCCAFQFWIGKKLGHLRGVQLAKRDSRAVDTIEITAGQALGQKNTVFAIWMGVTFMTPVTAVVGGFYSIWHNLYNSYQLREIQKSKTKI